MAIKFSQFITQTSASSLSHIVGYNGADNIQITPANFFTSFAVGNTGQVSYFDSASSLEGSNEFFWDSSNNRLGIGTNTPTAKLQIATDYSSSPQPFIFLSNNGSNNPGGGSEIIFASSISATTSLYNAKIQGIRSALDNGSSDLFFQTTHVSTSTAPSTKMTIKSDGNVGIGTTSPSSKLQVSGTLDATGISQLGSSGSNVYLTSSSAGSVGIGTSSPVYKLDVTGDSSSGVIAVRNLANGRDTFRSENAAGTRTFNIGNDANGHGLVLVRGSGGTVTNYITGNGYSYFNGGNVGIGISSPVAKLHVYQNNSDDDTTAGVTIEQDGTGDAALSFLLSTVRRWRLGIDNNDLDKFKISSSTNLSTNNKLTIDVNGNVGIGTSSPSQKLAVTGNIGLSGSVLFEDNQGINFGNSNARIYGSSSDGIKFNANGSEAMRLNQSGKVGIGTANPTTWKLNVDSGDIYAASFDTSNNTGVAINGNNTTAAQLLGYSNSASTYNDLDIRANSTPGSGIYIDGSGSHVGVGTTSPTARFEIQHPQQTTQFDRDCFLRLHPSAQTDSGGFTNMFFGTSTTNNYGVAIGGLRAGSTDSPSFSIRMLDDAITGTEVFNISSSGNATFAGNVTLSSTNPLLLLANTTSTTGKTWRFSSAPNGKLYITQEGVVDAVTLDHTTGNATFAGNVGITNILHIDGAATGSPYIDWRQNGSQKAYIQYADTGDDFNMSSDGKMTFKTSGENTVLTLDTSQNATFAGDVTTNGEIKIIDSSATGNPKLSFYQTTNERAYIQYADTGEKLIIDSDSSLVLNTNNTARLTIDSNGVIQNADIDNTTSAALKISNNAAGGNFTYGISIEDDSTNTGLILFSNAAGTSIGSITRSGSSTVYATSSDYRLKEDLQDFAGLDMISKIPVYDFKWKADNSSSYGVMAHELQDVLPDAVSGEKDGEEMQGVDYSKVVPLLIKSIQELKAEVEDLKSKI